MGDPGPRSGPGSQGGSLLPADALYEILLRLPAKELCRLRAVCRPWRCLLSDPHFIAAHVARHPAPLIVVGYHTAHRSDGVICDIMDLSGRVVKRVRATEDGTGGNEWVRSIHLDFICTSKGSSRSFRLLNLATGAVRALPEDLTEEHAAQERNTCHFHASAAFGQVPSTGEYKVLRVLDRRSNDYEGQLFEVFTLNGSTHARWRGKKAPPNTVWLGLWKSVVINGIVYFFSDEVVQDQDAALDRIASFDLETEEWRPSLQGPLSSLVDAPGWPYPQFGTDDLSITSMNCCLVVVHRSFSSRLDLWFLTDFERGLWVKQHSIEFQLRGYILTLRPLLVLNDGRIVLIYVGDDRGSLRIYNPRMNTSTDVVQMGSCCAAGLYTGSLLSFANWEN